MDNTGIYFTAGGTGLTVGSHPHGLSSLHIQGLQLHSLQKHTGLSHDE